MKRHKSRTLISRTLSKVRSRLSSFDFVGESPNPLLAPPTASTTISTPTRQPRPQSTDAPSYLGAALASFDDSTLVRPDDGPVPLATDGAIEAHSLAHRPPSIATLQVKTLTWTVFGTHPKYPATAYVNIDLACEVERSIAAAKREEGTERDDTLAAMSAGQLFDLTLQTTLTGPGSLIKRYGHTERRSMETGQRWLVVLHIGIKDTSLASKLSTSFRSLGGRLGRISNVDVINRWLDVLHRDTAQAESDTQRLQLSMRVEFRHSLLPCTTLLVEERDIEVAMTETEKERAHLEGINLDSGDDGEDEERLREFRVLGAPWL